MGNKNTLMPKNILQEILTSVCMKLNRYFIMNNNTENKMTKSELQEKLTALYLRLNGYFTTGFIIHSSKDTKVDGEIDVLGVRFSNHQQKDRVISCSKFLDIPKDSKIDLIIGEVKGGKEKLQFNKSLRENDDRRYKLLTWLGFINDNDIPKIDNELSEKIATKKVNDSITFERIDYQSDLGLISIRPIIFAPDKLHPRKNQVKYIGGQTMLDFCLACFNPVKKRPTCETDYWSIDNWGEQFESLVRYFKLIEKNKDVNMNELYKHFKI